jgi:hypothetical protein
MVNIIFKNIKVFLTTDKGETQMRWNIIHERRGRHKTDGRFKQRLVWTLE